MVLVLLVPGVEGIGGCRVHDPAPEGVVLRHRDLGAAELIGDRAGVWPAVSRVEAPVAASWPDA
jgi:hypothetical protein